MRQPGYCQVSECQAFPERSRLDALELIVQLPQLARVRALDHRFRPRACVPRSSFPVADPTSANTAARICLGRSHHRSTTARRSGSVGVFSFLLLAPKLRAESGDL